MSANVFYGIKLNHEIKGRDEFEKLANKRINTDWFGRTPDAVTVCNVRRDGYEKIVGTYLIVSMSREDNSWSDEEPTRFEPPSDSSEWDGVLADAVTKLGLPAVGKPGWFVATED